MRAVIQRVLNASCTVDQRMTGKIEQGLCLFVGFEAGDDERVLEKMASKIIQMRIFEDDQHKMNRSLIDIHGSILSISQFTLYADCKKGNRPGFSKAAPAGLAASLYEKFNEILRKSVPVETGIFQADMKIALVNDGPITIWLDSKELTIK